MPAATKPEAEEPRREGDALAELSAEEVRAEPAKRDAALRDLADAIRSRRNQIGLLQHVEVARIDWRDLIAPCWRRMHNLRHHGIGGLVPPMPSPTNADQARDAVGLADAWLAEARASETRAANSTIPPTRHSDDYRFVHWYGAEFSFTATQATCVAVLWRNWERGTPEIGEDSILTDITVDSDAKRLIDVFRDKKHEAGHHPAWKTMIVPGRTKGSYRLNPPGKS